MNEKHSERLAQSRQPLRGHAAVAIAVVANLAAGPVAAQLVTSSGDVSPSFAQAASVNLAGQRIFLGFTNGAVGTQGTLSVTGGGSLTAAQIVPGVGGLLGTGTVTVDGIGSIVNLTGGASNNGLDIGSWGSGTMTVSNGATVACSSPSACPGNNIGNAAGSIGLLTINGGVLSGFGSFAVGTGNLLPGFGTPGAATSATLNITNNGTVGGFLSTTGRSVVGANYGQTGLVTGNVTIDGAGSIWAITRDLANGGAQAALELAPSNNGIANFTISNGGSLTVTGSRSSPATDNSLPGIFMSQAVGATSTMTVTTGGSLLVGGDTGVITVGGTFSTSSAGAKATLNITDGGSVSGTGLNGLTYMVIGRNLGEGIVNVSGAGSQLLVAGVGGQNTQGLDGFGGLIQIGLNRNNLGGGIGTLDVTNGGSVLISDNGQVASTGSMGLRLADGIGTSGTVKVSGPGSSIVLDSTGGSATTPYVSIGQGGMGKMTVEDGGTVFVQGIGQRNFIVGNSSTGSGTLDVKTGAQINASWFVVGNGGAGVATINNSTVALDGVNYNDGTPFGASVRVGRGVGANGVLNLENGAAINIDNSIINSSVLLGGTSTALGGTGVLNMSGGSTISFTGAAAGASFQVGATSGGTGTVSMTGNSVVNVGATGSAVVGTVAGSTGTLVIDTGSSLRANIFNLGGNSDAAAGGTATVTVKGAGSKIDAVGDLGQVIVGRGGGTGTLNVTDQGTISAKNLTIGRAGTGTLLADNATISLSGDLLSGGNFFGAALVVGNRAGNGTATIHNSTVTVTNASPAGARVLVGGTASQPLGTGVLSLTGGTTVNINAAAGLGEFTVGHDGNGTVNMSGPGTTVNVNNGGSAYVGRQSGSIGLLNMSNGAVLNAGFVGVGVSAAGTGNAPAAAGGSGTLTVEDSTVHTGRFEVGAAGAVNINAGGTLNVSSLGSAGAVPAISSSVYVAQQAGSTGTLVVGSLAAPGAVLQADFVGIGVNAKAVGGVQSNGGAGTLVLNNSTINTTHFELGANSLLTGDGGVINAGPNGPVIIGGTVSPGNSPGRLRINCDLTMLAGSKLILEISGSGVDVDIDQLIIGEESNFDIFQTQIIFSFLGNTNPEDVVLDLNEFLRAGKKDSNETTGLQALFAKNGLSGWDEVVNSENFGFQSTAYDVTGFEFNAETGRISGVEAAAIPEPASIALVLLALASMALASRRRAARRGF